MLWTVCHLRPPGDRFFKRYCHHSSFILRNGDSTANILHSREGVTQGYPLAMFAYGIGALLLIKLKEEH